MDSENRVLGYFLRDMFFDLLKLTFLPSSLPEDQFYRNVNKARDDFLRTNTELWLIIQYPRPRLEAKGRQLTLRREATNAEAYRLMIEEGQDVVLVVDNEHRYAGVMTRRQIEGELFLKVLENPF